MGVVGHIWSDQSWEEGLLLVIKTFSGCIRINASDHIHFGGGTWTSGRCSSAISSVSSWGSWTDGSNSRLNDMFPSGWTSAFVCMSVIIASVPTTLGPSHRAWSHLRSFSCWADWLGTAMTHYIWCLFCGHFGLENCCPRPVVDGCAPHVPGWRAMVYKIQRIGNDGGKTNMLTCACSKDHKSPWWWGEVHKHYPRDILFNIERSTRTTWGMKEVLDAPTKTHHNIYFLDPLEVWPYRADISDIKNWPVRPLYVPNKSCLRYPAPIPALRWKRTKLFH